MGKMPINLLVYPLLHNLSLIVGPMKLWTTITILILVKRENSMVTILKLFGAILKQLVVEKHLVVLNKFGYAIIVHRVIILGKNLINSLVIFLNHTVQRINGFNGFLT